MQARIYQPTKTAMQSVAPHHQKWILEFEPQAGRFIDDLMGWTGSSDMQQEITLKFVTKEAAIDYATKHKLDYEVIEPKIRQITPKSYASNFN